jgi:hypothetical protein
MNNNNVLSKSELWKSRISDYYSSGLSIKGWCSANHCPASTLRYWIAKFKCQDLVSSESAVFAAIPSETIFATASSAPVTMYMGSIRIEIANNCHPDLLTNLVGTLKTHV